ncbi:MAG: hypothetical protein PHC61_08020 [Chitinivibrionales bacterium]|nr:hypothetical protein [Chitinivibrionales bacterium]
MNPKLLKALVVPVVFLSLVGCGFSRQFIKPSQPQIDSYLQAHSDLAEVDKACISDGRFEIGMRDSTVYFLLGAPKSITMVKQPWAMQEMWNYKKSNVKIFIMEDKHVVGIQER